MKKYAKATIKAAAVQKRERWIISAEASFTEEVEEDLCLEGPRKASETRAWQSWGLGAQKQCSGEGEDGGKGRGGSVAELGEHRW